jgi:UDP-N-acetyl-D-glucosamine dehydrogenase
MAEFVVMNKLMKALNKYGKPLKGSKVLLLGVTYKADIDDMRESPALKVLQELMKYGVDVSYSDPYVPEVNIKIDKLDNLDSALDAETSDLVPSCHSALDAESRNLFMSKKDGQTNEGNIIKFESQLLTPELLSSLDAVIILAPHSSFDYEMLVKNTKLIIDTKNTLSKYRFDNINAEIIKL